MWRSYHISVYLFLYYCLILQIVSTNGLTIPLSRPASSSARWNQTNSSPLNKNQPSVLTNPYLNCGSGSSKSNFKTDKYFRGTTNSKTVGLDCGGPVSLKSNSPSSNAVVVQPPASLASPIEPQSKQSKRRRIGSSYSDKAFKNPGIESGLTNTIALSYDPLLTLKFDSSSSSVKKCPMSHYLTTTSSCERKEPKFWNSLDSSVKRPSCPDLPGSSLTKSTISKPVKNSMGYPVPYYANCENKNDFARINVNDKNLRWLPPPSCPQNIWPYSRSTFTSALNVPTDPIASTEYLNSCPKSAPYVNVPFTPYNTEKSCNPYLPAVNLPSVPTSNFIKTVSDLTPAVTSISCPNNDILSPGPKFKVKSMELKILPMPLSTGNPIQGTVKPLMKNKTLSCFDANDNNFKINSEKLSLPTMKLDGQSLTNTFETPCISDTEDLRCVSPCDKDSHKESPKIIYFDQHGLCLLNTLLPLTSVDSSNLLLDIGYSSSPMLNTSCEIISLKLPSSLSAETLIPLVCINDLKTLSPDEETMFSLNSQESESCLDSFESEGEMESKCISDISIDHAFQSIDSVHLIESSNITKLPECNVSTLENLYDKSSSSELFILEKKQVIESQSDIDGDFSPDIPNNSCDLSADPELLIENSNTTTLPESKVSNSENLVNNLPSSEASLLDTRPQTTSEINILEKCLSSDLLSSNEVMYSELPAQEAVSKSNSSSDLPQILGATSEQVIPILQTVEDAPLTILDIINPLFSSQILNETCSSQPRVHDVNYFYTDLPILQIPTDSLSSSLKFPNDFFIETIDVLPFEQIYFNNVPVTNISDYLPNISVPIETLSSSTLFPDVNVILLPYIDQQLNLGSYLKTDEILSSVLDNCDIIDSTIIPNTSLSHISYDLVPYFVYDETSAPNIMLTPVSYLLDYQLDSPDVIIEPFYIVSEDNNLNEYVDTLVFCPDNSDSFFELFTTPDGDILNDLVPSLVIVDTNNSNDKTSISDRNSIVQALPIIDYVLLSSASKETSECSSLEKIPDKVPVASLSSIKSDSGSKSNRKLKLTKSGLKNTKRRSRKRSSKCKSDITSGSVSENNELRTDGSSVTVSDMPYYVSILQNSLDGLSSVDFDDCALYEYNTVNLDSTTPLPAVIESNNDSKSILTNDSTNSLFILDEPSPISTPDATFLDYSIFDNGFNDVEEIAQYIVLKELLNSDATSNWDLLGKIINILCSDSYEN